MANAKARFTVKRVYQVIDATTGEAVDEFDSPVAAKDYAAEQNQLLRTAKCEVFEPLANYPGVCTCGWLRSNHTAQALEAGMKPVPLQRHCLAADYNNGVTCESGKDPNYPQLWCHACQENKVNRVIGSFPKEFGLRAYPGKRFHVSLSNSYFSDFPKPGTLYLYTEVLTSLGWESFCKGTVSELQSQIVDLKPALLSVEEAAEIRRKAGAR